jgi:hypothetical protein
MRTPVCIPSRTPYSASLPRCVLPYASPPARHIRHLSRDASSRMHPLPHAIFGISPAMRTPVCIPSCTPFHSPPGRSGISRDASPRMHPPTYASAPSCPIRHLSCDAPVCMHTLPPAILRRIYRDASLGMHSLRSDLSAFLPRMHP